MCAGSPEVKPDGSVFTLDTEGEGTVSSGAGDKHEVTPFLWGARDPRPTGEDVGPRGAVARAGGDSRLGFCCHIVLPSVFSFYFEVTVDSHAVQGIIPRSRVLCAVSSTGSSLQDCGHCVRDPCRKTASIRSPLLRRPVPRALVCVLTSVRLCHAWTPGATHAAETQTVSGHGVPLALP